MTGIERLSVAARKSAKTQFTALLHHVNEEALLRSFWKQKRRASAGVDGITVEQYEVNLMMNLRMLCHRVHSGKYRPQRVRRVYIPKTDGTKRPLGIPTLEDKILQGAVSEVLSAIYEVDFLGFSYGFRPNKSPHNALSSMHTAMMSQRVNWVLDADIRRFFDSVDHEWLMRILAHRIADPRIHKLIRLWLEAGILESNTWSASKEGTPQGSGISPLLANIFLHYVLDLWFHKWRRTEASGRAIIVRYADDFIMGFEKGRDAYKMLALLKERLAKFGLTLHEVKTKLIEFGRLPALSKKQRGLRRPETFSFLGFTHYCGWTRDGRFMLKCKTQRERFIDKLKSLRVHGSRLMHASIPAQHSWLKRVLLGHYAYYGRPHNSRDLIRFHHEVRNLWKRLLQKRSQKSHQMSWQNFEKIVLHFPLPQPRIMHSW